jgi:hypothetical protein
VPLTGDFGVPQQALADIARVEWALEELFDIPDFCPMSLEGLATVPAEAWEELTCRLAANWSIIATIFDVKPVIDAVASGEPPRRPAATPKIYMVFRRAELVHIEEMSPAEAAFITQLAAGQSFFSATEDLAAREGKSLESTASTAIDYLRRHILRDGVISLEFSPIQIPQ